MTIKLPLPTDLTHHETLICMWIGSDPPLLEQMRLLVTDEPYNPIPYDFTQLSSVIHEMLYDPAYGKRIPDLLHVMQNGGDLNNVGAIRSQVPKRALYDIEEDGWNRIRAALLAGWEQ